MHDVIALPPRHQPDIETEFLALIALRDCTNARLDVLADALRAEFGPPLTPLQLTRAYDKARVSVSRPVVTLPASGLSGRAVPKQHEVRPSLSLKSKGGRDA